MKILSNGSYQTLECAVHMKLSDGQPMVLYYFDFKSFCEMHCTHNADEKLDIFACKAICSVEFPFNRERLGFWFLSLQPALSLQLVSLSFVIICAKCNRMHANSRLGLFSSPSHIPFLTSCVCVFVCVHNIKAILNFEVNAHFGILMKFHRVISIHYYRNVYSLILIHIWPRISHRCLTTTAAKS